jgi:uncharacterized protein with HEPN domain
MTERSRKYLSDILIAIAFIEEFISDISDFSKYQYDWKTKSAVERQLVIIGEAVNHFRKESGTDLNSSHQVINFRHRLVHAYDAIDDAIVWVIIQKHLPGLKEEVEELIQNRDSIPD